MEVSLGCHAIVVESSRFDSACRIAAIRRTSSSANPDSAIESTQGIRANSRDAVGSHSNEVVRVNGGSVMKLNVKAMVMAGALLAWLYNRFAGHGNSN